MLGKTTALCFVRSYVFKGCLLKYLGVSGFSSALKCFLKKKKTRKIKQYIKQSKSAKIMILIFYL